MGHWFAKQALGGLALLALGCSGRDILLNTNNGGAAGGGDLLNPPASGGSSGGGDSTGGSFYGDVGGRADGIDYSGSGEAGRSGWVAYDADLDLLGYPGRHIQIATTDGQCGRPLTKGSAQEKQPAFSADGKQIAFASDSSGTFQIYVMDVASGRRTQITNEADGASYPSWSPTGKKIAYVTGDIEDQTTSNVAMLVDTATLETIALTAAQHPPYTWSAFASDDLLLIGNKVSLIGIHTDTLAQYDAVPITSRIANPTSPSISPDGAHYVFSDYCGRQQLYIARVDGKTGDTCANATPLAAIEEGLISASWGPSGYVAAETGHHDIALVPSDGSLGIKFLVGTPAAERNPAFAPSSFRFNCSL